MTETINKKIKVSDLSGNLREWLASVQLMLITIDLNQRLGISGKKETVIPLALWKLVSGQIEPTQFVPELSRDLEISPSAAKALAQEIEEKMLRPIEFPLRSELGIDIKTIYLSEPAHEQPKEQISATPTVLIPSPEVAHPQESKANLNAGQAPEATLPNRVPPIQSPVYSPIPATPKPMPTQPPAPKVEPLIQRPAPAPVFTAPKYNPPIPAQPAAPISQPPVPANSAPSPSKQVTPIPVKVMPSKVPGFLKAEDFKNPNGQ